MGHVQSATNQIAISQRSLSFGPHNFFFFFNFFAWGFAWKKVLTMDQLKRSG